MASVKERMGVSTLPAGRPPGSFGQSGAAATQPAKGGRAMVKGRPGAPSPPTWCPDSRAASPAPPDLVATKRRQGGGAKVGQNLGTVALSRCQSQTVCGSRDENSFPTIRSHRMMVCFCRFCGQKADSGLQFAKEAKRCPLKQTQSFVATTSGV